MTQGPAGFECAHDAPGVTIGLAVYNGEQFLAATLKSILEQTFTNFELVISDNASTDGTEEICERFAAEDKRIRYIRQAKNLGACENFNFLFRLARGNYFKWAAADDLLGPDYLAVCTAFLDSHAEFVLVQTHTTTIDEKGLELPNDIVRCSGAAENPPWTTAAASRPSHRFRNVLLGNGNPVYDTAVLDFYGVIRREILGRTNLMKPYIGYEKVLLAHLALLGRIAELPDTQFAYRLHSRSVSSQTSVGAQRAWSDPAKRGSRYPRLQYLCGYVSAVLGSRLGVLESGLALIAIARYLLQVKKWKRVFLSSVLGRGVGDGNAEILRQNAARLEKAQHEIAQGAALFEPNPGRTGNWWGNRR